MVPLPRRALDAQSRSHETLTGWRGEKLALTGTSGGAHSGGFCGIMVSMFNSCSRLAFGLSRVGLVLALTAALLMASPSPTGAVAGFGDVPGGTWYTDAVQWSVDNGIANFAASCFEPDAPVSRGETAVWIYHMEGQPAAGDRHSFTDVTNPSQHDAISWMADTGITTGRSATTFAPDDTLTRAQVAAFLHRLAGKPSAPRHDFSDVIADWQQDAVSWMADTGITTGTSATTFAPDDTLTRAQLVTFLYRYQEEPDVTVNSSTPICDTDEPDTDEPPPMWIFAENIPAAHQTALRDEMEHSRAYISDRFDVEATGFTVLVGDHEWMSPVYRDMTGGGDFSLVSNPHASSDAFVFDSATDGAVMALVYGHLLDESLNSHTESIIHEYFHVVQLQLAAGFKGAFWLVEGSASYADYVYSLGRPGRRDFSERFTPYVDLARRGAGEPEFLNNLSAELARYEDTGAFYDSHEAYPLSFIAISFLIEEQAEREDSFVNYWKLLGERSTWQQAFEEAFGIPVDDFYRALDDWAFPIPRLVELRVRLRLSEGQLGDIPGQPRAELEHWGTWESRPRVITLFWSHEAPEFYVTYMEGSVGAGYLSLWWSDDHRTYCLRGWYKDGDLTSNREDATAVEFTGNSAKIDWNIPSHPSTLPSLGCRER